ncbi:MAG: DUF1800 domain-containing protein [Bacteroidota bacterium]|nr:DUF1800 domain-containing protein [Bacteroidota bacterium]
MKKKFSLLSLLILPLSAGLLLSSFKQSEGSSSSFSFPYKQAGLTDREAAAHIMSRFSFGAKPGQVDVVAKKGVEDWFKAQLEASFRDDSLNNFLLGYESLAMTNAQIVETYPKGGQLLRKAIKDGVIDKDSAKAADKKDYRQEIKKYMDANGLKPQAELFRQLINQKILRATYSENQLKEVLTDFWFNHFNVTIAKGEVGQFVTSYERDVIRPNVFGKFETLLLATAKSPAMLTYLDNFKSTVNEEDASPLQKKIAARRDEMMDTAMQKLNANGKVKKPKMQGLNENYAREIMELHTLGVDGGYTQTDVTQAARILTGWTLNPEVEYNIKVKNRPSQQRMNQLGFVVEDDFLFAANKHDKSEKKVLGVNFPAGAGYDEGVKLIHLLATHPSTAKFISRKLATRFVSDNPSQSLIDKMAKTFLEKEGSIKEVLITMVSSPEFWVKNTLREKTKSPFELAISSVRSLNAKVEAPYQLFTWMTRMGQKVYSYQAPTGFPDRGQYWINTGSLLNRMNFGLALASGRIPGIKIDLLAINQNHEPESAEDALKTYGKLLMPERDIEQTIKRLTPMLNDPELIKKVDEAAGKTDGAKAAMKDNEETMEEGMMMNEAKSKKKPEGKLLKEANPKKDKPGQMQMAAGNNTMLAQVVGIILGSPEFQRK